MDQQPPASPSPPGPARPTSTSTTPRPFKSTARWLGLRLRRRRRRQLVQYRSTTVGARPDPTWGGCSVCSAGGLRQTCCAKSGNMVCTFPLDTTKPAQTARQTEDLAGWGCYFFLGGLVRDCGMVVKVIPNMELEKLMIDQKFANYKCCH